MYIFCSILIILFFKGRIMLEKRCNVKKDSNGNTFCSIQEKRRVAISIFNGEIKMNTDLYLLLYIK